MASDYLYSCVDTLKKSFNDPISQPIPLVLATTAGTVGAWLLWTKWRSGHRKLPPSPRGWPLFGNLLDVSDNDMHLDAIRLQNKYNLPDIFTLNMGLGNKIIMLNSYDVIKDAFMTNVDLFAGRPPSLGMKVMKLTDDIIDLAYDDPEWKNNKAFLMSALRSVGFGNTKSTEDKILGQIDMMIDDLEPFIKNNEPVDFTARLEKVTANVIFEILFNKRYNHDDPELTQRIDLARVYFKELLGSFVLDMLPEWIPKLFMRKTLKQMFDRTEDARRFIREEIKEHQATVDPECPRDFIDIYLTKKKGVVDLERLTNNVLFMIPDAVDTMACHINWIILYLVSHPATMKRMQDELDKVTGGNRQVTMSDRPKLPFTEAAIMEIIRIAVPTTMTALHCAPKDSYFRGYFIPKNMITICNLYNAMRDPNIFERPDEFNPDRLLDKEGKLKRCDAWIPFSMGTRKCAGEQLTKTELFLFTANLFQKYDFSFSKENPAPSLEPQFGILIRAPQSFKVVLKPRN